MYNSDLAKLIATGQKHLIAGINENITVSKVRVDRTPNNNVPFIEFTFEDDNGSTLLSTVFEPSKEWCKDDNDYKLLVARTVKRLMEIAQCFHKNELEINVETFEDFCKGIKEAIENPTRNKTKLRIMVTYNNNGYLQLRKTASYTNVERMDVDKSNIFVLSNDKLKWDVKPDREEESTSGLDSFIGNANKLESPTSELPF